MPLSWNEIRLRATAFAKLWADARYESGESQTFYNDFFEIFGVPRRRVASFEEPVQLLGDRRGFIDLLWKGVLIVEQKSAGGDLIRAKKQVLDYFPGLSDADLPRFVLVSDFQTFELYDLEEGGEPVRFPLSRLADYIESFGFILGRPTRAFLDQEPVNVEVAALMGSLHDALKASGYTGHDLERFLVRLVFCLFADDTGIFEPRDTFAAFVERAASNNDDLGAWLAHLFEVLDTPEAERQANLSADFTQFPYINGALFHERLRVPFLDPAMRKLLDTALGYNWAAISPAIFGSLFQSVMEPPERRAQGAHYTTGDNILKVIRPLFLDDLRAEFQRIAGQRAGRRAALEAFHSKLAGLKFFDPACGCGNFLVIAYRELRRLELDLLRELRKDGQLTTDVADLSRIDVDQFYGIELGEFAARIAEVAMWMTDHLMNLELAREFGVWKPRFPLRKSPHIHHADALETDWVGVLAPTECSYILGNPPFGGSKYQSPVQRAQVQRVTGMGRAGGTLDYVAAWFILAGRYVCGTKARIGFVATNSITQGEQVAQLWPILFGLGLEITFAHGTFAWQSEARGMAHVHVVILGLAPAEYAPPQRRLFGYDDLSGDAVETRHQAISPYLFDASRLANPHLVVHSAPRPLTDAPPLVIGSKPIDDGHYIFTAEQRRELLEREPAARELLRPFLGATEFLYNRKRWILYLAEASPAVLRSLPAVRERIANVRAFRSKSSSPGTRNLPPTQFHVTVVPKRAFLVIPETSSELRAYVPIGWLRPPVIPSNLLRVLLGDGLYNFGVLTSAMHLAWLRQIGGRLKSDYRYSIGVVYNTFPWPAPTPTQRARIEALAQDVLDARASFPDASLADLYDAEAMPPALAKAHRALDAAVDKLYRPEKFNGDRDRAEFLFGLYEKMVAPLGFPAPEAAPRAQSRRGRR